MSEVFAARDLPKGTVISYDLLAMRERPAPTLSPNTVRENVNALIGVALTGDVKEGDGLNWAQLEKVRVQTNDSRVAILEVIASAKDRLARCAQTRDNLTEHGTVVLRWEVDGNGAATPQRLLPTRSLCFASPRSS